MSSARPRRRAGPGGHPGLHHLGLPGLRTGRPLPAARRATSAWAGCTSRRCPRGRRARRHDLSRPRRRHLAAVPARTSDAAARRAYTAHRCARSAGLPADPPRPDQAATLPGAELDRRLARLPARLRLLLQGGVLRGRPLLLHPDRRRGAGRDRAAARAASLLPGRPPVRQPALRRRRCSRGCAAWAGCGRRPGRSTPVLRRACSKSAVEAGLRSLFVGFETLDPANLREQRKFQNLRATTTRRSGACTISGVMVNGSFVFGMDDDDESVFDRTVEWAIEQGIETATFHILTPYPGTALHKRIAGSGAHHRHRIGTCTTRATRSFDRRGCRPRTWKPATGARTATSIGGDRSHVRPQHTATSFQDYVTSRMRPDGRSSSRCGTSSSAPSARE